MSGHRILVVVDQNDTLDTLNNSLEEDGWGVEVVDDASEGVKKMRSDGFAAVVVSDGASGQRVRDLLTTVDVGLETPIVALVNVGDVRTAVDAMRLGAVTALELDDDVDEAVIAAIGDAIPKGAGPVRDDPRSVIVRAEGSPIEELLSMLPQIARSDAPVLVTGESGTGKELLARTIHNMSPRNDGPFVAVNCGAIPETLLESELFGYVKGAFTGARADKKGYFEAANDGTIFLDEIGEMPTRLQVKFLRVLQDHKVQPVGSRRPVEVDFRVIAATNRDLEKEIGEGNFREDLYYRIGVLPMHISPLRERPMDVPVLAEYFLKEQNLVNKTRIVGFTREVLSYMKRYDWPGNVRELENLVQRLSILKQVGYIERDDLPPQFLGNEQYSQQLGLYVPSEGLDMAGTLEKLEKQILTQALRKSEGNKAAAARLLGLNRTTLVEKVKRLHITLDDT
jgi:DNA-binding NtrC family response regulator